MSAALGLLLVAAALGVLLYSAIWKDDSPPEVRVDVISVVPMQNGYLVQFNAVNQGGSTAQGVIIEGQLTRGTDKMAETSHTTLEYLPSHSEVKGGLFFTQDPRQFDFQVRALGYEVP